MPVPAGSRQAEVREALRDGGVHFRLLAEAIPQIVWTAGPDGNTDYANQRWYEYTGLPEADGYTVQAWRSVLHPDDVDRCFREWWRSVNSGEEFETECRLRHRDGGYRWHVGRAVPLRDHEGRIIKWFGTSNDINEQKHAAEQARRIQAITDVVLARMGSADLLDELLTRTREVLHADTANILVMEPDGGTLRVVASKGLEEEVLQGVRIPMGRGIAGRVAAGGRPVMWNNLVADEIFSPILRAKAIRSLVASPLLIEGRVTGVLHAGSFRPNHFSREDLNLLQLVADRIALVLEHSRLQRVENEGRQARLQLAAIVESSDEAIIGKDLQGIITAWNKGAERMYGYKAEEVLGKHISILTPDRGDEIDLIMEKLRHGQRIQHFDTIRVRKDGSELDVSISVSPIRDANGKVTGAATIARDMTQRKRTEDALRVSEKLATVGRMAATIAHEINNPLEAVTNVLFLLNSQNNLDEQSRAYLAMAEQEVGRISHIVKHTLGFHRESSSPVPVNLSQLLDNVLELYRRKLKTANIRVERQYEFRGELRAFPGEMRQVFSNLIVNALEISPPGGRLKLRLKSGRAWGSRPRPGVRITVCDQGPGIPRENFKLIFEPFFTTKGEKGTGLGLWVSQGIVQKHGGTIRVRSSTTQGKSGTVFSVFLPFSGR